jgi:glycosyltransferase involved in cell wall biosynthesis
MFSIICATFNRKEKLKRTVRSVLSEEFENFELIVVDDASSDGTKEYLECLSHPRLRFFRLKSNRGVGFARNYGIRRASYNWIIILDSDNSLATGALGTIKSKINAFPRASFHNFMVRSFEGEMMCELIEELKVFSFEEHLISPPKGEFHSVIRKHLYLREPFLESVMGGEHITQNKILRIVDHIYYHNVVTELYDNTGDDRLSLRSKNFDRIASVYGFELCHFWKLYIRSNPRRLITLILKISIYRSIAPALSIFRKVIL